MFHQLAVVILILILTECLSEQINEDDGYYESFLVSPNSYTDDADLNRNAVSLEDFLWPNGTVTYGFDDSYDTNDRIKILTAMNLLEQETCIEFREKSVDEEIHYIKFIKNKNGCGTSVGYHPQKDKTQPQIVALSNYCVSKSGAIQHELLHIVGLFHEQCRYDRDEYIKVIWDNVEPTQQFNFEKVSKKYSTTFGLPYDFKSLMHYPREAFSKNRKSFTMVARNDSNFVLGQPNVDGPTFLDLEKVRRMYHC